MAMFVFVYIPKNEKVKSLPFSRTYLCNLLVAKMIFNLYVSFTDVLYVKSVTDFTLYLVSAIDKVFTEQ